MEPLYTENFSVTAMHTDCFGRAKPSALLFYIQEAAGGHCDLLHLDWNTLAMRNLFWAVIRTRVEILRLPLLGEEIRVETWPMPTTRSAFPRATVAYGSDGTVLFRAISLWVLMDTEKRSMVLPGKSGLTLDGTLRGGELVPPGSIAPQPSPHTCIRQVHYQELDRNGHMNNTRYLDWVDDLLPSAFHKAHPMQAFTVCYLNEALEGQTLTLHYSLREDRFLQVDGHRTNTDVPGSPSRIFSVQAQFS